MENMSSDKFRQEDLVMLRKTFEEKDWDGFSIAMRRLSGDHDAGTQTDTLQKYTGQYIKQDEITGEISRLPYLEERHQVAELTYGSMDPTIYPWAGHCWRDARATSYYLKPAVH